MSDCEGPVQGRRGLGPAAVWGPAGLSGWAQQHGGQGRGLSEPLKAGEGGLGPKEMESVFQKAAATRPRAWSDGAAGSRSPFTSPGQGLGAGRLERQWITRGRVLELWAVMSHVGWRVWGDEGSTWTNRV